MIVRLALQKFKVPGDSTAADLLIGHGEARRPGFPELAFGTTEGCGTRHPEGSVRVAEGPPEDCSAARAPASSRQKKKKPHPAGIDNENQEIFYVKVNRHVSVF